MGSFRIAVLAGDGIGREVIPAGVAALEAATRGTDVSLSFTDLPWGSDYYHAHGRMMPEDGFDQLSHYDAIYMGAIGSPAVPDRVTAAIILAIRQRFDQYVNLRPMRLLAGLTSPLANRGSADIDMICVRENSEGEYSGVGGRIHVGTEHEVAQQVGVFTRKGIERILRYGFELAAKRPRKLLASATKSNALTHSMVLWDEVAEIVRHDYPAVEYRKYHVDALAARMITHPQTLDILVIRRPSMSWSRRICSATSSPTSARRFPAASASRPAATSTRHASTRRCSNRFMDRRPTLPAKGSPTRLARSGPGR
jgi:tartrate dehydrogenase/decarboxylase / D-malate dehydrogenase